MHQRPRGNLSDLYPRWLGARELLLHHRNPYGDATLRPRFRRAITAARWIPISPAILQRSGEGFAYPVYVVFLLAPLVAVPFLILQTAFYWFLAVLTAASVGLWLASVAMGRLSADGCRHWRPIYPEAVFPPYKWIKLQQLSLLVAGLLAAAPWPPRWRGSLACRSATGRWRRSNRNWRGPPWLGCWCGR